MATHTYNTMSGLSVTGGTGGVSGNSIPTGGGIEYVRYSDDGVGLDALATAFSLSNSASTAAYIELKMRRGSLGFEIEARDDSSFASGDFTTKTVLRYEVGGTSSTLTTAAFDNAQDVFTLNGFTPSAIKMKYTLTNNVVVGSSSSYSTYSNSYVNDTWLTTSSVGDNIQLFLGASASAAPVANNIRDCTWIVEFWGRVSGYDDTKIWEIRVDCRADAEAEP